MNIDKDLIAYLEDLSKLRLTDRERSAMAESLEKILAYMDKLGKLDTAGMAELSHPFPSTNCFREDVVTPSFTRDRILAGAPRQKDGCFQVPKTVE